MNIESAKLSIKELIEKYNKVVEEKRVANYNEEMTKKDFILPLFRALGWDVENSNEVTAEEKISKKRVDYGFRINGIPKFFLEAKSLGEDLEEKKYIAQAINYAWHKGCTWAVLTNFSYVRIYNAEWKTDNFWQTHFRTIPFHEFLDRFSELWLLSKESFEQGLIDKEAERLGKKTRKISVDKQLLADFTRFRELLSKNIMKLNQSRNLTEDDLDESVQRILDRLIFIRNCEDRELEAKTLISGFREWESRGRGHLLKSLREIFTYFDKQYNSKLFQEHLCDDLEIDNEVLHEIIEGLYYTKDRSVSYDFSAIEADVLGSIYEQYLGHILKKSEKRAKLTENHAHRKEHGIYYTPTYIVDYIVKNTVKEYCKDKTLEEISKIRILDPACGSGSFLIKAFDELYSIAKERIEGGEKSGIFKELRQDGELHLGQKFELVLRNIFGVDLDKKAMEITQLSLLLKLLENEGVGHKGGRVLPIIQNIKNGNSLIDDPAVAGDKAFKWEEEFEEVTGEGGFDVVVGNPPWSSKITSELNKFLARKYGLSEKNVNICALFILEALKRIKQNGYFGFLLPKVVIKNEAYQFIRKEILENYQIKQIVDFGQFPGVASDAIALIIQKKKDANLTTKISFYDGMKLLRENYVKQELFKDNPLFVFSLSLTESIQGVINKIKNGSSPIKEIFKIKRGIELGQKSLIIKCPKCGNYNEANIKYYGSENKQCKKCGNKLNIEKENTIQISSTDKQKDYVLKCIAGTQLKRYAIVNEYYIKLNLKGIDYKEEAFNCPKILIKRISTKIEGTFSEENLLAFNTVYSLYGKNINRDKFLFILGLLNSKLIHFFYEHSYNVGMNLTTQVTIDFLSKIPIKAIPESQQQPLITLVDRMLSLNKRLNEIGDKKTDARARIEEEIKRTDTEIDELVYKIYGITEEETKIIEESLK